MKKIIIFFSAFFLSLSFSAQNNNLNSSNIQTYTPSKLLDKGSWDVKWFNNLYTENETANSEGKNSSKLRENFFTSSIDIFTGISETGRLNIGVLLEYRSNTIGGREAFSVFDLGRETGTARKGFTSFAPAIKFQPFKNIGNFSIQSAFHIPIIENEFDDAIFDFNNDGNLDGVFLDQTAYTFQNRFFYDYTFPSNKWQLFTELSTEYNFGEEDSFANNTYVIAPGIFMSYFPSQKSTILGFVQHLNRFGDFTQDYTALGFGGKYQLSETLNMEVLYSKFVRGTDNGLGQSFNIGLRYLLTK